MGNSRGYTKMDWITFERGELFPITGRLRGCGLSVLSSLLAIDTSTLQDVALEADVTYEGKGMSADTLSMVLKWYGYTGLRRLFLYSQRSTAPTLLRTSKATWGSGTRMVLSTHDAHFVALRSGCVYDSTHRSGIFLPDHSDVPLAKAKVYGIWSLVA